MLDTNTMPWHLSYKNYGIFHFFIEDLKVSTESECLYTLHLWKKIYLYLFDLKTIILGILRLKHNCFSVLICFEFFIYSFKAEISAANDPVFNIVVVVVVVVVVVLLISYCHQCWK